MATYRTQEGDTVDLIAYKYYGNTGNKIVERIHEVNKQLSEYDAILPSNVLIELPEQSSVQTAVTKKVKLWD